MWCRYRTYQPGDGHTTTFASKDNTGRTSHSTHAKKGDQGTISTRSTPATQRRAAYQSPTERMLLPQYQNLILRNPPLPVMYTWRVHSIYHPSQNNYFSRYQADLAIKLKRTTFASEGKHKESIKERSRQRRRHTQQTGRPCCAERPPEQAFSASHTETCSMPITSRAHAPATASRPHLTNKKTP